MLEDKHSLPPRIILDHKKMSSEYVPLYLPHRESEVKETLRHLYSIVKGEKDVTKTVIYTGPTGTGKTAVAKRILVTLGEQASSGKLPPLMTSYVNAYDLRSKYAFFRKIGEDVGLRFPRKGFSTHEVITYIFQTLSRGDSNLVLVIDEADLLVRQKEGEEILYILIRLRELLSDVNVGLGMLAIFRDFQLSIESVSNVGIKSSLSSAVIRFNPYTSRQLSDILRFRIEKEGAIRPGAVNDEVIDMIANTFGYDHQRGGAGDARMALKALYYAAMRAESQGRSLVLPEDVREVLNQGLLPTPYDEEEIKRLQLHEKLLLLAITNVLLVEKERAYVSIGDVEFEYEDLCNRFGVKPLRHTSIWERIQFLKHKGLVDARVSSVEGKGRSTHIALPQTSENEFYGINRVPLNLLQKVLEEMIERDLKASSG
ncbi:Cdc6/Cdc18 family protein [Infirmifilum sp. NZ]|uniref:Cdc6/Cdc18 family protein n=1 Tax=Infirmifilum sp. NZ TaxID=2926850 RepID=UPI0027A364E3|nr:AAA family ATPase [Infirmifilum sp. NZ]UNQ74222.1 AAA family ATPase [Infirmifilum sp. NZ]